MRHNMEIGMQFGAWTVTCSDRDRSGGKSVVICRCHCGKERAVKVQNLVSGRSMSCGCERRNTLRHGESHTRLHVIWCGIIQRCNDINCRGYKNYGARGIGVCAQWDRYEAFRDWALSSGYSKTLVVDRIDTLGNYEPSNCRWVTQKVNSRNTRANRLITAFGETKCLAEWAEDIRCVVKYQTLHKRIVYLNWPPEQAIAT